MKTNRCEINNYGEPLPIIELGDNTHAICFSDGYLVHNKDCCCIGGEQLSECICGYRQLIDADERDNETGYSEVQCKKCKRYGELGPLS